MNFTLLRYVSSHDVLIFKSLGMVISVQVVVERRLQTVGVTLRNH